MEPNVGSLILHPALLMASGVETLTSRDMRILNSYRLHFYENHFDHPNTIVLSESDFMLGGILNPMGSLREPHQLINQYRPLFRGFPYVQLQSVKSKVYLPLISEILNRIHVEIKKDIQSVAIRRRIPINTLNMTNLKNLPPYNKIAAVHMCGFGSKLREAFDYYLEAMAKD